MKTLSQKLAINLEYFTSNPKKRCSDGKSCRYWGGTLGIKTKGCFVGALMPLSTRQWADKHSAMSVATIIRSAVNAEVRLPKIITENRKVMQDFQSLHDDNVNWGGNGLSRIGREALRDIFSDYPELKEKDFAKSLAIT